ncbi:MAG TPA: hypothetical protein VJ992_10295 [Gemmatimonadales bacterium]|nr:hypothetical protein [Gemmatimonadales bacterium]
MNAARGLAAVAAVWVTAGAPHQGVAPTPAERAAFRRSLVAVTDAGPLRWHPLRGATGYEILTSRDGRRYRLEDLVTGHTYRPKRTPREGSIWYRVVAMRATKTLADTTDPIRLDPHRRGG